MTERRRNKKEKNRFAICLAFSCFLFSIFYFFKLFLPFSHCVFPEKHSSGNPLLSAIFLFPYSLRALALQIFKNTIFVCCILHAKFIFSSRSIVHRPSSWVHHPLCWQGTECPGKYGPASVSITACVCGLCFDILSIAFCRSNLHALSLAP